MLRKGYVEKQIEAIGTALGFVLRLVTRGEFGLAMESLRTAGKELTGMDPVSMARLSEQSLLGMFRLEGELDTGRCLAAAAVLKEQGEILSLQSSSGAAITSQRKALLLYLEVMIENPWLRTPEHLAAITKIQGSLRDEVPTAPMLRGLYRFEECMGRFDRAEDLLYELRDRGTEDWAPEAKQFYERLLKRTDEALEAGKLPREEVLAGLAESQEGDDAA